MNSEDSAVRIDIDDEREALIPVHTKQRLNEYGSTSSQFTKRSFSLLHLAGAFTGGIFVCILAQYAVYNTSPIISFLDALKVMNGHQETAVTPSWVGPTTVHHFPPPSATNVFPTLFPTNVDFPGVTPTGAEAAIIATAPAYPIQTGAAQLVIPETLQSHQPNRPFDLLKSWGTLSPWYSVEEGAFGIDSGPRAPDKCRVTGLHLLHRHGARYPHSSKDYGGPAIFAGRLNKANKKLKASGDLTFLNEWTYKLGEDLLTPFGRQQLYDLGVSMRLKYGFLLQNFSGTNTIPVFRTTSQNRVLNSALNFALGFFGYPLEGQYQQSIIIEAPDFNNTLAHWHHACPNNNRDSASQRAWRVRRWAEIYLKSAKRRLQAQLSGLELTTEDVYAMQQMCPYESVAIGYSKFCELFTQEEWEGFDYAHDLLHWYKFGFGSPFARVQVAGWIQEMIHRLERKPVTKETNRFSMNFTLDGDIRTFPVDQSLYVDTTHEEQILGVITALNLTSFAEDGPLPYDYIPKERKFRTSRLSAFGSNIQFQLLSCSSEPEPQIRIIINDGVVPLTGIEGCHFNEYGLCSVETFVRAQRKLLDAIDWDWICRQGRTEVGDEDGGCTS
ncbi:phosphoglycerate mutase-like protein [Marasmius fiardii PR-910]|nr:phosphoglycerate mutase-like protein [Marasmius fiardii PR-910]